MLNFHNVSVKQVAVVSAAVIASLVLAGAANKHRTGKVLALWETSKHERDRLAKSRDGIDLRIANLDLNMAQAQADELRASAEAANLEFARMAEAQQRAEKLACGLVTADAEVVRLQAEVKRLSPKAAAAAPKEHAEGEGEAEHRGCTSGATVAELQGTGVALSESQLRAQVIDGRDTQTLGGATLVDDDAETASVRSDDDASANSDDEGTAPTYDAAPLSH